MSKISKDNPMNSYTIELTPDSYAGGWVVSVKELPGCLSQGNTIEEAMEMIHGAMEGWSEIVLEDGDPVPEALQIDIS